jgi:gamma-glutamyl-gamma-aminobutyrate hydrolase PuuD
MPEDKLIKFLDQINGAHFTGGSIEHINRKTGELSPYFKSVKTIVKYSMDKKDKIGESWPIIGICQGYQVIACVFNDDKLSVLDDISMFGDKRPVKWEIDPAQS